MLWSLLRCLCCSHGLHSSLRSWASKTGWWLLSTDVVFLMSLVCWTTKAPGSYQRTCFAAVPGQEPDDVAAAVLQLIKLPGFGTASDFDFDNPYSR